MNKTGKKEKFLGKFWSTYRQLDAACKGQGRRALIGCGPSDHAFSSARPESEGARGGRGEEPGPEWAD